MCSIIILHSQLKCKDNLFLRLRYTPRRGFFEFEMKKPPAGGILRFFRPVILSPENYFKILSYSSLKIDII